MFCFKACSLKLSRGLPLSRITSVTYVHDSEGLVAWKMKSYTESRDYWRRREVVEYRRGFVTEAVEGKKLSSWRPGAAGVGAGAAARGREALALLSSVRMSDLKEAPLPVFWYGAAGLVPVVAPTLSALLVGHSPFLDGVQLAFAATVAAFLGGVKWGYALPPGSPAHPPTWRSLGLAVAPQGAAALALLVPTTLGYLVVSSALASALLVDLAPASAYPPWFSALRVALTLPVLLSLFLSFLVRLFAG